ARVHDVDDAAGATVGAVIEAVEVAVCLVDPVEVPEEILGSGVAAAAEAGDRMRLIEGHFRLAAVRRDDVRPRTECGNGYSEPQKSRLGGQPLSHLENPRLSERLWTTLSSVRQAEQNGK